MEHSARRPENGEPVLRSHEVNLGKGAVLHTGRRLLAQRDVTHVLTMDGDGHHRGDPVRLGSCEGLQFFVSGRA